MVINSLINISMHGAIAIGILLICNSLLFSALEKLKHCGHINHWVVLVFDAAYRPVLTMLWVLGIFSIYYQVHYHTSFVFLIEHIEKIQYISFSIVISWFLFQLNHAIKNKCIEHHQEIIPSFDPAFISICSKIAMICISMISIVIMFHAIGISLQTLSIFQGAFLIAFGFAAQNLLGNFFGCIMILINRPFRVGDWISSPDKKIEGIVEDIGWNSTKIRTLDRRPLYIPNSIFTHIIIMNSSLMYNRQIKQIFQIRYQDADKIMHITQDIDTMLQNHCDLDHNQICMAHLIECNSHALAIEVHAFTITTNRKLFRKIQQDIFIQTLGIIEYNHAQIAIPYALLHPVDIKNHSND